MKNLYERMLKADRDQFFKVMFDKELSLIETLIFYVDYDGPIYGDQVTIFYDRLAELLPKSNFVQSKTALREDFELAPAFLDEVAPHLAPRYFRSQTEAEFEKIELLAPCAFEWRDDALPLPYDPNIYRARRGPFNAYIGHRGTVFLGPAQFLYFFGATMTCVDAASMRVYSDAVLRYPRRRLLGDAVLVQDTGSGANFGHFAFDWLPRLLYLFEAKIIEPASCHFLMGGDLGAFQSLLLHRVCASYGLQMAQFIFPDRKELLDIEGKLIFFSDTKKYRLHPAQMAHPKTLALLRDLARPIATPPCAAPRIFISRSDAGFRKIENEDALFDIAHKYGFEKLILSDLPIEEQIAAFRSAQYIVGAHGMGMTHLLFHERQFSLLELYHPINWTDAYAMVTRAFGGSHHFLMGTATGRSDGSYVITPEAFEAALGKLLRDRAPGDAVLRYDSLAMTEPPCDAGLVAVLEPPRRVIRRLPEFIEDLSGQGLTIELSHDLEIHGSRLIRLENVLLFGQNHLVTPEGFWCCEARSYKQQFLHYMQEDFYSCMYPGAKPRITGEAEHFYLKTAHLGAADVECIDVPVFLATPLEPLTWGRWLMTVLPKIRQYKQHGSGRKFFCFAKTDWQRAFLTKSGLAPEMILLHDPGRTYLCRDVMTVQCSAADMTVSAQERENLYETVLARRVPVPRRNKIFVSRLTRSKQAPHYRVLQNEQELAAMLEELGFVTIEPEFFSFEEQVSMFAAAEQIMCLGGSGLFNAAFCAPGTSVIDIESSTIFVREHANLLASLDLRHGIIFGTQDPSDTTSWHKRWTLDVLRTRQIALEFFATSN